MSNPPVPHGQLPPIPEGAEVTAWGATLPPGMDALSPRVAMIVLMHVSWWRWSELARLLKQQMDEQILDALSGQPASESHGVVGHKYAMNPKDSKLYATGEEIRALAELEGQERDRCSRLAREAHDMGLFGENW
jgi:hypothetical protein